MKTTALIMAGGRGERFWPKSRRNLPKQFLCLTNDDITMIQHTVNRILPIVNIEDIYISTNRDYLDLIYQQLPEIPKENVFCEPVSRNTAPCIAIAALHMQQKYQDATMIVLPSDHLIKNTELFIDNLNDACTVAENGDNLVTIGITPMHPETGYGYIKFHNKREVFGHSKAFKVTDFIEKPNLEKAKEYLSLGVYLWNSGMFVFKVSTILQRFKEHLPGVYNMLEEIKSKINTDLYDKVLNEQFVNIESVSIDYGIMEKTKNLFVIPGNFGWDDVGSWCALERINKTDDFNNIITGNVITIDAKNSIIQAEEKLIAVVGVDDLIVVDTPDATLICNKNDTDKIKKILENLRICNKKEYM